MTVADHLHAARQAHDKYRRARGGKADAEAVNAHARAALEARLAAHDLDPDHSHPAWASDPAPHDALVAFYRTRLGVTA